MLILVNSLANITRLIEIAALWRVEIALPFQSQNSMRARRASSPGSALKKYLRNECLERCRSKWLAIGSSAGIEAFDGTYLTNLFQGAAQL